MTDTVTLDTALGSIALRIERAEDVDFLYDVFSSHTLPGLAVLPMDEAIKVSLVRMQFKSQTATYRALHPNGRFAILERDGVAIGRLVVDEVDGIATIVDLALLPDARGGGIGSALMTSLLEWLSQRCRAVRCTVLCTNVASLRMCERVGFVRVGEQLPHVELEWQGPIERPGVRLGVNGSG